MKTLNGIKTVMSVLAEEEKTNRALIASFQYDQTPDDTFYPQITEVNDPTTDLLLIGPLQD